MNCKIKSLEGNSFGFSMLEAEVKVQVERQELSYSTFIRNTRNFQRLLPVLCYFFKK